MSIAMKQLPLFRRLPTPKRAVRPEPIPWQPNPWSKAVAKLWGLPKHLLSLIQPQLHLAIPRGPQKEKDWKVDPSTLPYGVKPTRAVWWIQNHPPPKPLCYDTMQQWQEFMMRLDAEGHQITRRHDTGKHTGKRVVMTVLDPRRIDYCAGCNESYRRKMQGQNRCIVPRSVAEKETT